MALWPAGKLRRLAHAAPPVVDLSEVARPQHTLSKDALLVSCLQQGTQSYYPRPDMLFDTPKGVPLSLTKVGLLSGIIRSHTPPPTAVEPLLIEGFRDMSG